MTDKTQEPVAFDVVCHDCGGDGFDRQDSNYRCALCNGCGFIEKMLYTSPPAQRKPLTDEEVRTIVGNVADIGGSIRIARAIEARILMGDKT